MLFKNSLLFTLIVATTSVLAQQSAVYFKQNALTGILKSARFDESNFIYTNGKEFVMEDDLGNVRYRSQINITGSALIRDLFVNQQKAFALYQIISPNGQLQFGLLMLNQELQIQWFKVFGASGASLSAYSVSADANACYIVNNNCTNGLSITKIDLNSEVVWNKTFHTGNGTIVPEHVAVQDNKLVVYSKHTNGNQVSLVVSTFTVNGTLEKSDKYILNGSFLIKNVIQTTGSTYILINYSTGNVSSEILQLQNGTLTGYLINYSQAIQINDLTVFNNEIYMCGNILQGGNEHLNAILMSVDLNLQPHLFQQISSNYNANIGYDDAMSVISMPHSIIVAGINADKGFVLSYNKNYGGTCVTSNLNAVSIQNVIYQKSNMTLSEGATPDYNKINNSIEQTPLSIVAADYCSYEIISISSVNETVMNSEFKFLMFPNPASDNITIEVTTDNNSYSWEMSDISGRLLKGGISHMQKSQVSIADLPNGMYIIYWKSGNESGNSRLMISR